MTATVDAPSPASPSDITSVTSLPALLLGRADSRPKAIAMRKKHLGRWRQYTWEEYAKRAAHIGLGLLELGVQPGERVAIHSNNRPSWLMADIAIQGIG